MTTQTQLHPTARSDDFAPLNATTSLETLFRQYSHHHHHYQHHSTSTEIPPIDVEQSLKDSGSIIRNTTITPKPDPESSLTSPLSPSLQIRAVDLALTERGLPHFHAITENYFHIPLPDRFNWNQVASLLGPEWEGDWYLVAFRSVRKENADSKALYDADALAHSEALESGGLLKYWYGSLNEKRECLAMCIWSSREFARLATRKPYHILAQSLAGRMYESYTLERWSLQKLKGETFFKLQRL